MVSSVSSLATVGSALVCFALAGCMSAPVGEPRVMFSLPITGQFNDGSAAAGQASAMSNGVGVFWVKEPGGARCEGSYGVRNPNPTLVVPITCSDGATGEAVITRQPDLMSGSAIVALNNGRRGQVVFGNLRFEQAFGAAGMARTQ